MAGLAANLRSAFAALAVTIALMPANTASAQEAPAAPGWVFGRFSGSVRISGPAGDENYRYPGVMLYTGDPSRPGVILTCSARHGTGTTLSYAPRDFSQIFSEEASQGRLRFVGMRLVVDGERGRLRNYIHRRQAKLVEAIDDVDDMRLINAIAKDQPVRLEIAGLANIDLDLPPADEDFAAFIAACPALSYKK